MIAPRSVSDLLTPEVEFECPGDPDAVRPVRLMTKEHADPAMLAARHMLRLALSDPTLRAAAAANGKAVIVLVPDAAWLDLVIEQWTDVVRGGVEPRDGDVEMRRTLPWVSFKRSGQDKIGQPEKSNEAIDFALWNGTAVTAFGTADRHLPGSIVAAADHRIVIAPPARSTVRFLVRCMFGRSCIGPVTKDLARSLTPSVLRQARRPGQSAEDYLGRLVAIVGRNRDSGRPGPMLEQLHGMPEATAWGMRLVRDLEDYRLGRVRWTEMDRGLLLHGTPGTGKGLFVEALSRSCGIPLVATSFATWQAAKTGHLGDCLAAMRADFDNARRLAPCILYIDELDAIGSREGGHREYRDYWTAVITGLLEQLDGVGDREGVVTVGATNHPGALDPALVRSGRFDRSVAIPMPDQAGLVRDHPVSPRDRPRRGGSLSSCAAGNWGDRCRLREVRTQREADRAARRASGQTGRPLHGDRRTKKMLSARDAAEDRNPRGRSRRRSRISPAGQACRGKHHRARQHRGIRPYGCAPDPVRPGGRPGRDRGTARRARGGGSGPGRCIGRQRRVGVERPGSGDDSGCSRGDRAWPWRFRAALDRMAGTPGHSRHPFCGRGSGGPGAGASWRHLRRGTRFRARASPGYPCRRGGAGP